MMSQPESIAGADWAPRLHQVPSMDSGSSSSEDSPPRVNVYERESFGGGDEVSGKETPSFHAIYTPRAIKQGML